MIDKGARTTGMTSQSTPKHVLVQKLQGAIQNLRREREQEYREKVESEERLRLASEEQSSLATIVAGLKTKQENLRKRKATVETNIVQLEADVKDLTEKVGTTRSTISNIQTLALSLPLTMIFSRHKIHRFDFNTMSCSVLVPKFNRKLARWKTPHVPTKRISMRFGSWHMNVVPRQPPWQKNDSIVPQTRTLPSTTIL